MPVAVAPVHHPRAGKSVGDIIDLYEAARRREGGRIKRIDGAMRTVRNGLADFLDLPAKQLTKADVRAARDKIGKRAVQQADRFLAYLGPIWKWASSEDHVEVNFVPDVLKIAPQVKRDRVLTDDEVKKLWDACGQLGNGPAAAAFGRMLKFALLTGQRRDEVASLKYGHVIDGRWKQLENKASRPHTLKLPQMALELIGQGEPNEYCFAGAAGKISGFSKVKAKLDKLAGIDEWRIHDLRRTFASGLLRIGIDRTTIHLALNHSLGSLADVYMVDEMAAHKAAALERWSQEVARIVGAKGLRVVS